MYNSELCWQALYVSAKEHFYLNENALDNFVFLNVVIYLYILTTRSTVYLLTQCPVSFAPSFLPQILY